MRKLTSYIPNWPRALFAIAILLLIYNPIIWLVSSWFDPSYDSSGLFLFLICLSFFVWSVTSPIIENHPIKTNVPIIILLISAVIRLTGQVLAVNVIGALTLVLDVYAVARLCRLDQRLRAISPLWLAVSFAFSLPLERIVQRLFGYVLQNFSADGACLVLSSTFENVACEGVRIFINFQDVLVDLPCSGARAFLLLLFFFTISSMLVRPKVFSSFLGLLITIATTYLTNVLRICILAIGIGYPGLFNDIDVMSQPAHDIIGLVMLCLGGMPIMLWARHFYQAPTRIETIPRKLKIDAWWLETTARSRPAEAIITIFFVFVLIIISLPRKAYDVQLKDLPIEMPIMLNNQYARLVALQEKEKAYFTQYGGSARKAIYGENSLLIVKTTAPLRHLHAPDDCLRGLGMDVHYEGLQYSPFPTAIYKAIDSSGDEYRVAVTFVSSKDNFMTTNVSEAVWRWTQDPGQTWTAIQRISRWDNLENARQFDAAVMTSFELPQNSIQLTLLKENEND